MSFSEDDALTVEVIDKLVYFDAAVKETLRLYAMLPTTEHQL